MESFSISEIHLSTKSERTIDINPLPEKYCSFDCIFCPLGRTKIKTDGFFDFTGTEEFLKNLEEILKRKCIDLVNIYPDGEALANWRILDIIDLIKKYDKKVKMISNGYLFYKDEYKKILNKCDQVIGELVVTNEAYFQKIQRPLPGYTLKDYIYNLENFSKQYIGRFILDITILKSYSDSFEDIKLFKKFIHRINPDEIYVHTPDKDKFKKAFGINEDQLKEINNQLTECHKIARSKYQHTSIFAFDHVMF